MIEKSGHGLILVMEVSLISFNPDNPNGVYDGSV